MGVVYNRKGFGLYNNGCGQFGDVSNFSAYTVYTTDSISNGSSIGMENTATYGPAKFSDQFVPVDIAKSYQVSVIAKGLTNNYLGNPAGGHLGFASYDDVFNFIDLRNCKDLGDCQLTRAAEPGVDTVLFVDDASGWSTSATSSQRGLMLFAGSTYTYANGYSRHTILTNAYADTGIADIGGGEWTITLNSALPDFGDTDGGGEYPIGTWLANGRAGGTYNYAHGAPNHTTGSWTTYTTSVFTGGNRNSATPFRYGTNHIRFLNLANFNTRTETGGVSPTYALDNIIIVECPNGTAWPASLFERTNTL